VTAATGHGPVNAENLLPQLSNWELPVLPGLSTPRIHTPNTLSDRSAVLRSAGQSPFPRPIQSPASSGNDRPPCVFMRDTARDIAEALVNAVVVDGEGNRGFDSACINNWIEELEADPAWCGYPSQRAHQVRVLEALRDREDLAEAILSTCADRSPTRWGKAIVRETLGLPQDRPVMQKEARQAVLMALLGPLRQEGGRHHHDVDSCCGTSVAILLHDHFFLKTVSGMKSMLERDCIVVEPPGGPRIPVPAARHFSRRTQDVKLLRAWEYTVTSMAHVGVERSFVRSVRRSVIDGNPGGGTPDPLALRSKAKDFIRHRMANERFVETKKLMRVANALIARLDTLMDRRLDLAQFHADMPIEKHLGAFMLYDKTVPGDVATWKCIDSMAAFKSGIRTLLHEAAAAAKGKQALKDCGIGDNELPHYRKAIEQIAKNLDGYIGKSGMNEIVTHARSELDPSDLPWQCVTGGDSDVVATNLFGKAVDCVSSEHYPPDPERPQDMVHVLGFLFAELSAMRDNIQDAVLGSPDTAKVPVKLNEHEFLLMPGKFPEAWVVDTYTDDWVDATLRPNAEAHVRQPRTTPALDYLLSDMVSHIAHLGFGPRPTKDKPDLIRDIRALAASSPGDAGSYTLQNVYDAVIDPSVYTNIGERDREGFRDAVAGALLSLLPPPAIPIADMIWKSVNKPGSPRLLGALYNPLRNTVNLHMMDDDRCNHWPISAWMLNCTWFNCTWYITTTPLLNEPDAGN
jgi:hypothetical protein